MWLIGQTVPLYPLSFQMEQTALLATPLFFRIPDWSTGITAFVILSGSKKEVCAAMMALFTAPNKTGVPVIKTWKQTLKQC